MGKGDLVCVNNLMNMMGDFDTVLYKVRGNHIPAELGIGEKLAGF